jgi:hypothetical protein
VLIDNSPEGQVVVEPAVELQRDVERINLAHGRQVRS